MILPASLDRSAVVLLLTGALLFGANAPAAAQLANTPWPMFQHDVRHTGQSSFLGPLFPAGAPASSDVTSWQGFGKITSSPTIGADGTVYLGIDVPGPPNHSGTGYICAVKPDLTQQWCTQLRADASQSSAAPM